MDTCCVGGAAMTVREVGKTFAMTQHDGYFAFSTNNWLDCTQQRYLQHTRAMRTVLAATRAVAFVTQ